MRPWSQHTESMLKRGSCTLPGNGEQQLDTRVSIFSTTAGGWIEAKVVGLPSAGKVRVEYGVGGQLYAKTMRFDSEYMGSISSTHANKREMSEMKWLRDSRDPDEQADPRFATPNLVGAASAPDPPGDSDGGSSTTVPPRGNDQLRGKLNLTSFRSVPVGKVVASAICKEHACDHVRNAWVAVVGNGPLSDDQLAEINSALVVVRFNGLKNMRATDKMDILVVREECEHFHGVPGHRYPVSPYASRAKQILPIIRLSHVKPEEAIQYVADKLPVDFTPEILEPILHQYPFEWSDAHIQRIRSTPAFQDNFKGGCFLPDEISSGLLAVWQIQKLLPGLEIHVFGMNWNSNNWRMNWEMEECIIRHCSNCVVHDTPSRSYGGFRGETPSSSPSIRSPRDDP